MPRRRPGRVRAELPRVRRPYDDVTVIPGLSAPALGEVRRIERLKKYLWPGSVGGALVRWRKFVHEPTRRLAYYNEGRCHRWECCGDPWQAREYLEAVMHAMSPRRARELCRIVDALDREY